jgi:hypothetical protein
MIRFFTDISTNISRFCLLNIKRYNSPKKLSKKIIYIDPGVYELKESAEYSKISLLHELASGRLLENEYISIDYPSDMNEAYTETFIEKSIKNNLRYRDNPKYICTIQFKFEDIKDFVRQFEYLEEQIDFKQKIIGIGNLCRILHPNTFTDEVFEFLLHRKKYTYHFYGLSLKLIKKYLIHFPGCSVDSTKWTRAVSNELKSKYGLNCKKSTRDIYFVEYMNEIRKSGINIEY